MKEKNASIEFIKAISAIGIIIFHFACHATGNTKILYNFANGDWGAVFVTMFFIVSGGMLYLNNEKIKSKKIFYYKRFKAIFPSFYILFAILFINNVFINRSIFYNHQANPLSILLSVVGLDGYFSYKIPNYYIIGEWFLGAIILLYLLYPLLLKAMKKNKWFTLFIVTSLFVLVGITNVFDIEAKMNLLSCIFPFYIGMIIFDNQEVLNNKYLIISSIIISLIILFIAIPNLPILFSERILGIALFIVFYFIGNIITKKDLIKETVNYIGKISYQIFLLQHIVIINVLSIIQITSTKWYFIGLFIAILKTIIYAIILNYLTKLLLKTKTYQKIESNILKRAKN